ncbi:MAG: family 43 glycosylhydrolase, partial [Candidatus Scatosoma sp.]
GNDCWNAGSDFTLYRSDDLEVFEKVCRLVDKETLSGYTNLWAPEIHKYNGKYYLIVSVFNREKGRGSIVLYSEKLRGRYELLTGEYITPNDWWCLDATLFVSDGKPYLYFSNEWINTVNKDGDGSIFVAELSKDLTKTVSAPKKIVSGRHCGFSKQLTYAGTGVKGYVAEGPFVKERGEKTELYWSTYTAEGYCVVRSVADKVLGEYVFDDFIFRKDGGHCMVFKGTDGKEYITFHQPNLSPNERMKKFIIG